MRSENIKSTPVPNASHSWQSFWLSFGFHLIVFCLLLFLWKSTGVASRGDEIRSVDLVLATVNEQQQIEYLDSTDVQQTDESNVATALPTELPADLLDELQLEVPANLSVETQPLDAGAMTQVPRNTGGNSQSVEFTEEELRQIAAENQHFESQKPKGNPTTLNVFGSGDMKGRKFVFVLDRSKSMGSDGLGVIELAGTELKNAVDQLSANHEFQIVAYHHQTITMDKRALLPATEENKKGVPDFIFNLAAFGGTEHENALIAAISLRPDAIVLITDAGLPTLKNSQLQTIRRMADGTTEIHCIQFGRGPLQERDNFMSQLAEQNNGSYRYIDIDKL